MLHSSSTRRAALLLAGLAFAFTGSLRAQSASLTPQQARALVTPFYDMLNLPQTKDLARLSEQVMAPDWKSYASESEFKDRAGFVATIGGFGKLIPDLSWTIHEVLVDGERVIVRGEARGTPAGPFFGVPPSGKSFRIMSIDIHTFRNGKAVTAYHVEDWASALRQLTAK